MPDPLELDTELLDVPDDDGHRQQVSTIVSTGTVVGSSVGSTGVASTPQDCNNKIHCTPFDLYRAVPQSQAGVDDELAVLLVKELSELVTLDVLDPLDSEDADDADDDADDTELDDVLDAEEPEELPDAELPCDDADDSLDALDADDSLETLEADDELCELLELLDRLELLELLWLELDPLELLVSPNGSIGRLSNPKFEGIDTARVWQTYFLRFPRPITATSHLT